MNTQNKGSKRAAKVEPFRFKRFELHHEKCAMKIGTDGILLGAWAPVADASTALDIGTGCGLIAVMLSQRNPGLEIDALEIDRNSWEEARENMERLSWDAHLQVHHISLQEYAQASHKKYDLIVSNPPFFSGGNFSADQDRASVRHTVKLAHGDLLAGARKLLAEDGKFCLILPYIEGSRFVELAERYRLFCTHITELKTRPQKPVERLLLKFEKQRSKIEREELFLYPAEGDEWSEEYRSLGRDFYIHM